MKNAENRKANQSEQGPGTKERLRSLNCLVPITALRRAKVAAAESGLPFKLYMARLLMMAKPMCSTTEEAPSEPAERVADGIAQEEKESS
ncbi:MAG: hypothetical protein ABSG53_21480 [Thermoguttaceae bacterium]|jgi:hypothetical protein